MGRRAGLVAVVAVVAVVVGAAAAGGDGADSQQQQQRQVDAGGLQFGSEDDSRFAAEVSELLNATPQGPDETVDETADEAAAVGMEGGVFVPERDWKEVRPGQSIPQGLHVRLDLSTGKRMAKLLEHETEAEQAVGAVVGSALAQVRVAGVDDVDAYLARTVDASAHRRYPFVVGWLGSVVGGLAEGTDESCGRALDGLAELSNFIDDVDHAQDLARAGALTVVYMALGDEACGGRARAAAALCLGEALQNNLVVQERAAGDGLAQLLLRLLRPLGEPGARPTAASCKESARLVYALGALLRNCEAAQNVFEGGDGWPLLARALVTVSESAEAGPARNGLLRKLVALLFDLGVELGATDVVRRLAPTEEARHAVCRSLSTAVADEDQDLAEQAIHCLLALQQPCTPHLDRAGLNSVLASRFGADAGSPFTADVEYDDVRVSAAALSHRLGSV